MENLNLSQQTGKESLTDKYDRVQAKKYIIGKQAPGYLLYRNLDATEWEKRKTGETFDKIEKFLDLEEDTKYAIAVQKLKQTVNKLKTKWTEKVVDSVYKWHIKTNGFEGLEGLKIFETEEKFVETLEEMEKVKTILKDRAIRKDSVKKKYKKKYKNKYTNKKRNYYDKSKN